MLVFRLEINLYYFVMKKWNGMEAHALRFTLADYMLLSLFCLVISSPNHKVGCYQLS